MLELRHKDLAARVASFKTNHGSIETPILLPVVNPVSQSIPAAELGRMGAQAVITNAYMLWNSRREESLEKGVHKAIGFDGPVMTDSGAFQLMQYGKVGVTNSEIIKFQDGIGVDIGVPLDVPGLGTRGQVAQNCRTTLQRAKEAKSLTRESKSLWAGPVQGAQFIPLRRKCARDMAKLEFDVYPIGTVVPLMNSYEFALNMDIIAAVKQNIPLNKPVHHFGAGHPMFFALATAMGVDMFDSAAYSLFAKRGDYLTVGGTMRIAEMEYLPCSCPVCSRHKANELDEGLLARHNLYACFEEINRIKQAIRDNTLWELLDQRSRAHPALYSAFRRMKSHLPYLERLDPISKTRLFITSRETGSRVEAYRHKRNKMRGSCAVKIPPFGKVPCEVSNMYPFGQVVPRPKAECSIAPLAEINGIMEYLYGIEGIFPEGSRVERSRSTGRIRAAYSESGELLATFRAGDYMPMLHGISKEMHSRTNDWRVMVQQDTAEFPKQGKNVFAKFVLAADPRIRPGMGVLVVDEEGGLLAAGKALLSSSEMLAFDRGAAVEVRKGSQELDL